jgi:hypothetical protein
VYHLVAKIGLWCLTSLSTIFQFFVAVSFIGGGNRCTQRKPQKVTGQTLSHNVVSSTPRMMSWIRTHKVSDDRN